MGDGAEDCAHGSPSGAADGDAADAGARLAQQLRPDGGYWRAHAEPRPDDLRLPQLENVARWRRCGRSKSAAPGRRRQNRHRAAGLETGTVAASTLRPVPGATSRLA